MSTAADRLRVLAAARGPGDVGEGWVRVVPADDLLALLEEYDELTAELKRYRTSVTTGGPGVPFTERWENGPSSRPSTAPPEEVVVALPERFGEWCSEHGEEMQDHEHAGAGRGPGRERARGAGVMAQRLTRVHPCPGLCGRDVPNRLYACSDCWHRLPEEIRQPMLDTLWFEPTEHARAVAVAAEWFRVNADGPKVASVILFKPSGKYYTEEPWLIPDGAITPHDMERSPDFRRIAGGAVLVVTQEPWGYPALFPGDGGRA